MRVSAEKEIVRISNAWYKRQFEEMTLDVQREYVRVTRTNVNRKLNLLSKGLEPDEFIFNPAYQALNQESRGGVNKGLHINKMSQSQLFSEFQKNIYFLEAKTSTVKGAKDYFSRLDQMFDNSSAFQNLTRDQKREFWNLVKDLKDSGYYQKICDQLSVGSDFVINKIYEAYSAGPNTDTNVAHVLSVNTGVSLLGTTYDAIAQANNGYNVPNFIN